MLTTHLVHEESSIQNKLGKLSLGYFCPPPEPRGLKMSMIYVTQLSEWCPALVFEATQGEWSGLQSTAEGQTGDVIR